MSYEPAVRHGVMLSKAGLLMSCTSEMKAPCGSAYVAAGLLPTDLVLKGDIENEYNLCQDQCRKGGSGSGEIWWRALYQGNQSKKWPRPRSKELKD